MRLAPRFDPRPTFVRHRSGGFFQQQTLFWSRQKHSPRPPIHHDLSEIVLWIVTEHGQLKVVLPLRLGMAVSASAARFEQLRHDVIAERNWPVHALSTNHAHQTQ